MKDTRDMMVKDYDTCTDEELIARLRAGEREITDYLIDKYKSLVRTRARALYLVGGDHEDLIQEGMLRSEEHTSELQSHLNLVCRLLLEKTIYRRLRHRYGEDEGIHCLQCSC